MYTKKTLFSKLTDVINANVGKTVGTSELLLGTKLGQNALTPYMRRLARLGYIRPVDGYLNSPATRYEVLKKTPPLYNVTSMNMELRKLRGLVY